ncbi:hypothetical protein LINPERPRIM_LOCUS19328 [Linum perenne]
MENFRSKSCRDGRVRAEFPYDNNELEPEIVPAPKNMQGLRSYSVQRCYYGAGQGNEVKVKKQGKEHVGSKSRGLKVDPEFGRKRRVASYNAYAMEGKMKGSLRKSLRWVKDACNMVVHGWK